MFHFLACVMHVSALLPAIAGEAAVRHCQRACRGAGLLHCTEGLGSSGLADVRPEGRSFLGQVRETLNFMNLAFILEARKVLEGGGEERAGGPRVGVGCEDWIVLSVAGAYGS